ncbi:MAG: FMN-binding protein [Methylococcales bacterium]|nr:FMN-binding protein [Methylococcales bacterium]
MLKNTLFLLLLTFTVPTYAEEYQKTNDFLQQIFSGEVPKAEVLWLTKELKKTVIEILKHKPNFLRTRYWQTAEKSVWIINETGKTKPITIAIVITGNKIVLLKVLAFRESRGWEVKHDFFTDQFKQISLTPELQLNQAIDGISGATLSVRALTKVAQLALLFNQKIQQK